MMRPAKTKVAKRRRSPAPKRAVKRMPAEVRLAENAQGSTTLEFRVWGSESGRAIFAEKLREFADELGSSLQEDTQAQEKVIHSILQAGGVFFLSPRGCVMWHQGGTLKSSQMQASAEFLARLKTAGCQRKKSRSAAKRKG